MNDEIEPVFKDTVDRDLEEKARRIIEEKFKDYTSQKTDDERKKESQEKIKKIKEYIEKKKTVKTEEHDHVHETDDHQHDDVPCPTCKNHNLKIEGDTVKCNGPKCGEKFYMSKMVDEKRSHQCVNCGGAFTKTEIEKMTKSPEASCPLCNKGKEMIPMDWERFQYDVDEILKQVKKK